MSDQNKIRNKHLILKGFTETERFKRPRRKIEPPPIPGRDRHRHGMALLGQIENLRPVMETARRVQEEAGCTVVET